MLLIATGCCSATLFWLHFVFLTLCFSNTCYGKTHVFKQYCTPFVVVPCYPPQLKDAMAEREAQFRAELAALRESLMSQGDAARSAVAEQAAAELAELKRKMEEDMAALRAKHQQVGGRACSERHDLRDALRDMYVVGVY